MTTAVLSGLSDEFHRSFDERSSPATMRSLPAWHFTANLQLVTNAPMPKMTIIMLGTGQTGATYAMALHQRANDSTHADTHRMV